jgi:hypothetical protein
MQADTPRYRCPSCSRGVLNRRVSHCLFCGAQLSAADLAGPGEIVRMDEQAARERATVDLSAPPPEPDRDLVDKVETTIDVIEIIGDILNQ